MDYAAALHRVMSLVDLERTLGQATHQPRYDLTRMAELLRRLGDPHARVPAVHVAGTKGKGSTCAMIASILGHSGHSVGLYTSPHLHTIRERIRLGLEPLAEKDFALLVERVWPAVEDVGRDGGFGRVTTFEMLTAMALLQFADAKRDLQVLEVGLGGTLDATNVVESPLVCVLTPISLDHTDILGSTVEEIARDKAGIIKEGATVVAAPQPPQAMAVIEEACRDRDASLVKVEEAYQWEAGPWDLDGQHFRVVGPSGRRSLWIPLLGTHQLENACCALAAVEALAGRGVDLSVPGVEAGFREVEWPGRLEVLRRAPLLVVDGAHNPSSMGRLVEATRYHFSARKCILIVGCSRGHDLEGMVMEAAALRPELVLATRSRHPRSVPPSEIARTFQPYGVVVQEAPTVAEAVDRALGEAGAADLVLGTGSLFTAAEGREQVLDIPPETYPELERDIFTVRST